MTLANLVSVDKGEGVSFATSFIKRIGISETKIDPSGTPYVA